MPGCTSARKSSPRKTSSTPTRTSNTAQQAWMYHIPDGQTQLIIGIVPKETIIFDKSLATLLTDKKYSCAKCPDLIFDKKAAITGRSLERHVNTSHRGEQMSDLELPAPSSYRLRRKEKKSRATSEAGTEIEEPEKARWDLMTKYERDMELLKIGNPYRMNPRDTRVPVSMPEEVELVVDFVYPDPELYSI